MLNIMMTRMIVIDVRQHVFILLIVEKMFSADAENTGTTNTLLNV